MKGTGVVPWPDPTPGKPPLVDYAEAGPSWDATTGGP